jgi:cytokinin dehydrogenase
MLENWMAELQDRLEGTVTRATDLLAEVSEDFGRIVTKTPRFVVQPRSTRDVAETVRFAVEKGLSVSARATGHSESGQSLSDGGILLDMRTLNAELRVDPTAGWFEASAGVLWRDVLEALRPHRLIPPVLTNNLNTTVGGTCSTAGLGVASFRYGTQADQCLAIEVVTGTGDVVWCTPEENDELFYHVLGGLGQLGIITRIRHRLRPCRPMVRTYYLLYDDLGRLMDDLIALMSADRVDSIESWASPTPQGFRTVQGRRQPFAVWMYPLHVTVEFDPERPPDDADYLAGLHFYRHVHTEDQSVYDFALRVEPLFALWRQMGYWANAHPWMEIILPWATARTYVETVLRDLPPVFLGGGHILIWPSRGRLSKMPMFRVPDSDWVLGFGILPGIPKPALPEALDLIRRFSHLALQMGATHYLSGWVPYDKDQWRRHFGDLWPHVCALKRKYDPHGVLHPGWIPYEG